MRSVSKVRNQVAHSSSELKCASVAKFGDDFAVKDEQNVPTIAPMVGVIAGTVLDVSHANIADLQRTPCSHAGFARVLCGWNAFPGDCLER